MLTPFPPGPSQLRVKLFNSTYIARVTVPENGREMAIAVPDGLTPVRVTESDQPATGGGAGELGGRRRAVEAAATPNGDVLLEGVGQVGGTLTISAREHQTLEGSSSETPETQQEVALMPSPSARVAVRVVSSDGEAMPVRWSNCSHAAPAMSPSSWRQMPRGWRRFSTCRKAPCSSAAHAEGFTPVTVRIAEEDRASVVITLKSAQ